MQLGQPGLGAEVEGDGALVAISCPEDHAAVRILRPELAVGVTGRRLDLDHVGPEIGQRQSGERPGDVAGCLDHPNALERSHVQESGRSGVRARQCEFSADHHR